VAQKEANYFLMVDYSYHDIDRLDVAKLQVSTKLKPKTDRPGHDKLPPDPR
jgi:hypothetical protein